MLARQTVYILSYLPNPCKWLLVTIHYYLINAHMVYTWPMISLLAFVLVGGWLRDEILNHLKPLGAQEEW